MSQHQTLASLQEYLASHIIGQQALVERLIIALLADGHLLVEGAPGLAKTKAIKALADGIEADFHRVQFTPDLLPSDITGTEIYRPEDGSFVFQQGPIFHNLVLADEINRAPAKVQSALLEAMAERQISVGRQTFTLPPLFLVMATQNPIEQEGTYALPEAQLDRFLMHVQITYPSIEAERQILRLVRQEDQQHSAEANLQDGQQDRPAQPRKLNQKDLFAARQEVLALYMAPEVEEYLIQIIAASRDPSRLSGDGEIDLKNAIEYGASPRGTIALDRCARAHAWLAGKDYVSPDDVQAIAHDCLRHRLILSFEAEAAGLSSDDIIDELIKRVPVA